MMCAACAFFHPSCLGYRSWRTRLRSIIEPFLGPGSSLCKGLRARLAGIASVVLFGGNLITLRRLFSLQGLVLRRTRWWTHRRAASLPNKAKFAPGIATAFVRAVLGGTAGRFKLVWGVRF